MQDRNKAEWTILILMRLMGVSALLAIPAIFFPYSWMNSIHQYMGLGDLPDVPIVHYLARSLSAFYAVVGSIALYMSRDIRGNSGFVRLWGCLIATIGVVLLGIDISAGMPLHWTLSEGPPTIACGMIVIWLSRYVGLSPSANGSDSPG